MVRRPVARSRVSASFTISRTRGIPSVTALNGSKAAFVPAAMTRAIVVFPVPGGPQRMRLPTSSFR